MARGRFLVAATIGLAGSMALHVAAQPVKPIYLQYDGFVKNKNGSYTLVFGYYNTNQVDVPIQPGPDNTFVPAAADRNQPAVFLKGRHRFACTIVVPSTFDGKLQWAVKFAGNTSTTTGRVLDPLYVLELASEKRAMAGLDVASAPQGVCANHAPTIQVGNPFAALGLDPEALAAAAAAGFDLAAATAAATGGGSETERPPVSFTTKVDQELTLTATVQDDGLPKGSKVASTWKKNSGPGAVTFTSATTPATRATFSAPGEYEIELSATDGDRTNSVKAKVTVNAEHERFEGVP